jgi:DNA-binding HxlR family transcriptional regulator
MSDAAKKSAELSLRQAALVRDILVRVADQWTVLTIDALDEGGVQRFTQLRSRIGKVSQKMLSQTLCRLERDGLILREVHPVKPPRVEYRLTPLGASLGESLCGVWEWAESHLADVEMARQGFDRSAAQTTVR